MNALAAAVSDRHRRRNPRGMGRLLADEIVDGALRLVDEGVPADAITLRAVAREVGISAPSIYAHFADRDAIVRAMVERIFSEIHESLLVAKEGLDDPVDLLLAGCRAYVEYGLASPRRYKVLFACELPPGEDGAPEVGPEEFAAGGGLTGAEAFVVLVRGIERCVAAGRSTSTDPTTDAVAVWLFLHGLVSLRNTLVGFPWPPTGELLAGNVARLARLTGGTEP